MKKWNIIITILLFVLAMICFIFFDIRRITILEDPLANKLLCGVISRVGLALLFGWLLYQYGGYNFMIFTREFPKLLLWSLPCFMVAIVNFPFSSLISGEAHIYRMDLMGLYMGYVFAISLLEELIFRGSLLLLVNDFLRGKKHYFIWMTVICALLFSLFHLTNLFEGMGITDVLLQCAYTFLIGAMLTVVMLKTKNIWLCVLIHALFDFGGLLIIQIGYGNAWDLVFWILTITSGVFCAGHIIYTLIKLEKTYVS